MSARIEFPQIRRRHGVSVTIVRQDRRGYEKFRVVYYENGQRKEICRSQHSEALKIADDVLDRLTNGAGLVLELSGSDRLSYLRATEQLAPLGIAVDLAATEYAAALKLLAGNGTLTEAARFFTNHQAKKATSKDVAVVVEELLEAQRRDGSSPRHIEDLDSRLNKFANSFSCDISSVTSADIYDFLQRLKLSPRSRNNYRTAISNLFSFARLKEYVLEGYDPVAKVPVAKEVDKPVGIYSPAELRKLLRHSPAEFVPYIVIACFAGLRQSEIERLLWKDVGEKYIRVRPAEHRTKSNRLVSIRPNLAKWLAGCSRSGERVVSYANVCNPLSRVLNAAGVDQKHNGFRHSFGSYFLALTGDATKTSHEMGNTPKMVFDHYREVVAPEEAKSWFSISPEEIERLKITPLETQIVRQGGREDRAA